MFVIPYGKRPVENNKELENGESQPCCSKSQRLADAHRQLLLPNSHNGTRSTKNRSSDWSARGGLTTK